MDLQCQLSQGCSFSKKIEVVVKHLSQSLSARTLPFALPATPNFEDYGSTYHLDETTFQPGEPLPILEPRPNVSVFDRGERGCGTRNYIVVIGVTQESGTMARRICNAAKPLISGVESINGVVPVAHTEGSQVLFGLLLFLDG